MNATKPVRKTDIVVEDLGNETLLYNAEGKAIHVLNPAAKLIWELCDGQHNMAEMEAVMRASFSIADEEDLAADIERTIDALAAKGLLRT
jgi:hypothetical protein